MRHFYGFVHVRIMQALGAYGLRGFYERKEHFLQSVPYAVKNLEWLQRKADLQVKVPELTRIFKAMTNSSYLRQFGKPRLGLTARIMSFSYRNGVPGDEKGHGGGFVFDCRCLPNPGREERYMPLTGMDKPVREYIEGLPEAKEFLSHIFALVDAAIDNYRSRNFTDLMISFGCTGGRHRSVWCAERLAEHLKETGKAETELTHRELDRKSAGAIAVGK
jgi:RNase adaptor protein for sRNA GlmZ degradation